MKNVPVRLVLAACFPVLVLASGCSSCQQTSEMPMPVPKEGRLPRAPEPVSTAAGTPVIPPPACAVVASASPEGGPAPLAVQFSADGMCTDAAGTYTWDFGDGSPPSHDQNPAHTYATAGTFTVRLRLEDQENNAQDSDELPITVTAPQPQP